MEKIYNLIEALKDDIKTKANEFGFHIYENKDGNNSEEIKDELKFRMIETTPIKAKSKKSKEGSLFKKREPKKNKEAISKLFEVLKTLEKAEDYFHSSDYETGILKLLEAKEKIEPLMNEIKKLAKKVASGRCKAGKSKLNQKQIQNMRSFIEVKLKDGVEYTRADDKKYEKSAVAQAIKKFNVCKRTVQALCPKKSFK